MDPTSVETLQYAHVFPYDKTSSKKIGSSTAAPITIATRPDQQLLMGCTRVDVGVDKYERNKMQKNKKMKYFTPTKTITWSSTTGHLPKILQ